MDPRKDAVNGVSRKRLLLQSALDDHCLDREVSFKISAVFETATLSRAVKAASTGSGNLWMLCRAPKLTRFEDDIISVLPSCHIATHRMGRWNEGAKRSAWQPVTCFRVFLSPIPQSWQQTRA